MMQGALVREGMLLCDKSSRLLHQESQLKKWIVMETERIIRSDMRLYTMGKSSDEIVFSFSIDFISTVQCISTELLIWKTTLKRFARHIISI